MNKNQIKEIGKYYYSMPNWEECVEVEIQKINDEFVVRFSDFSIPLSFSDIPENAIFLKIIPAVSLFSFLDKIKTN